MKVVFFFWRKTFLQKLRKLCFLGILLNWNIELSCILAPARQNLKRYMFEKVGTFCFVCEHNILCKSCVTLILDPVV